MVKRGRLRQIQPKDNWFFCAKANRIFRFSEFFYINWVTSVKYLISKTRLWNSVSVRITFYILVNQDNFLVIYYNKKINYLLREWKKYKEKLICCTDWHCCWECKPTTHQSTNINSLLLNGMNNFKSTFKRRFNL